MPETIGYEVQDGIARIEFRRPDQHNAFNATMHREFADLLGQVREAEGVRVILLTAQGRTFIGGGDFDYLRQLRDDPDIRRQSQREGADIFNRLNDMPFPIVAAVHGHALGFGATIVTSCDIIVAWADAKLADPHVRAGIVAGDGGVQAWAAAAGVNRAKRYLLTGDAITMRDAYAFGLVTDLVDTPEAVLPAAEAIAARIAGLAPIAVQGTKRVFNALETVRNGTTLQVSIMAEVQSLMSDDLEEALLAAREKRPGEFRNR